jgi:IS1 family transposase
VADAKRIPIFHRVGLCCRAVGWRGLPAQVLTYINKSAIGRVERLGWNTVHRWLEKAASWCRRFSDRKIRRFVAVELQADEIRTIVGSKGQPAWVFVVIDVWSRLWPSTVIGKGSYRNARDLFWDLSRRMNLEVVPLITTDGFQFYEKVIGRVFGPACIYGQVIKTRRNDQEMVRKHDPQVPMGKMGNAG